MFARFKTTSGTTYDSLGNILNPDAGSKVVTLSVFVGSKAEVGTKINVWGFYNYDATICTCLNTVLFAITSVIPKQVVSLTSGIGAAYTLPYFEDEISSIKNTKNYCGKKSYVLTLSTGATPGFASVVDDVLTV